MMNLNPILPQDLDIIMRTYNCSTHCENSIFELVESLLGACMRRKRVKFLRSKSNLNVREIGGVSC
jgi:hypothetical protein